MRMGSKKSGGGLTVQNATVTYRNGHTALRNASFSIPRGTITALVGVNGAGKSTIFKAIMGFVPLATGSVSIFDLPVKDALRKTSSPMCRKLKRWTGVFPYWLRMW